MDPTQLGHAPVAYGLLGLYMIHGVLVMTLLRRRKQSTPAFRVLVHAADIVWPAVISIFAAGQWSPFFLFFFFVLAASAYRWGLWETLATAAAEVALLWIESFVLLHLWTSRGGKPSSILSGLQINVKEFEPKRLFMLSVYLLVMGLLLGYLARQQKRLRAREGSGARILSNVRVEAGLTGTLQQICRRASYTCGASAAADCIAGDSQPPDVSGELRGQNGTPSEFVWLDASPRDAKIYLEEFPGEVCYAANEECALVADGAGQ